MLKKILLTTLPLAAIVVSILCCGERVQSTLIFTLIEDGGSYYIEGDIKALSGAFLSSGKRIEIDPSTGELIPCEDDNGINSLRLIWGDDSNKSDTTISTVDGATISFNHTMVESSLNPDCPPPALSEVEFSLAGPDDKCMYEIVVSNSALGKGYVVADILFSLDGEGGSFKPLDKWQNKAAGPMDIWVQVKSTGQKINISESRTYRECEIYICDTPKKSKKKKEVKNQLAAFIESYNISSWNKLNSGKKLIFQKKHIGDVPLEEFKNDVEVNGDNMYYADEPNAISIELIDAIDCKTFIIKYSYNG
ncbi:hypothetical protein OAQ90_02015 [Schleiferiaceae bacterium]|nr:hypothetical protein [Schleiferiaceae bacterium]